MVKNIFIWLWYTFFVNPFTKSPPISVMVLSDNTIVTYWHHSGETFIHQPDKVFLENTFGLGWFNTELNFVGKLFHEHVNVEVKNPKAGQKVRIFNNTLFQSSLTLKVKEVFHSTHTGHIEVHILADEMAGKTRLLRDFTSLAEFNIYSAIIKNYLYLTTISKQNSISLKSVVSLSAEQLKREPNIIKEYFDDLIKAEIFVRGNSDTEIRASRALIYAILARL